MSVLLLNGKVQSLSIPDGIPAIEVIERHLEGRIPSDQVVCDARVDDGEVELPHARWGQFERLVVRTGPPGDLVRQGLLESTEVVGDIATRMVTAAGHLREGNLESFRPMFVTAIDDLLSFLRFLTLSQVYMGGKEAVMEQFQNHLKEQVDQLLKSQQQGDMVLLADLIEYEMVPVFEGWEGVQAALIKTIDAEIGNG
jgi:hypothetical protein